LITESEMALRLSAIVASRYRSLREVTLRLDKLNVFIGANASGKSNVLDALRFLAEGLQEKDFVHPTIARGGIVHLAWKGEEASRVELKAEFAQDDTILRWSVALERSGFDFTVQETVHDEPLDRAPTQLLEAREGKGWWWSPQAAKRVNLAIPPTGCALAAAAVDESFPARRVAEFVRGWGFFDPAPNLLRRAASLEDSARLEPHGRSLASRLHAIQQGDRAAFEKIIKATRDILGVPTSIQFRISETDGRAYFVQEEPGLEFRVSQVGASAGTLRTLALMTALFGHGESTLVAIEEPGNYIHPTAVAAFAEHLKEAGERIQVLVTTHSPLMLNALDSPEAVFIVRRGAAGTEVSQEPDVAAVRQALERSGFGLGEFYEARGFGS
jgi:predicted ATPase